MSAGGLLRVFGLALAIVCGLAGPGLTGTARASSAAPQAVTVEVFRLEPVALPQTLATVGTLASPTDTIIQPALAGRIIALDITPGLIVPAGTVLARLDDATEAAAFKAAAASRANALTVFQHDEKLLPLGGVSAEQALSDASALDAAEADLAKAKAALKETRIIAPFTGALGFPKVSLGAEVAPGQAITSLVTLDPLLVRFSLPQQDMDKVRLGQRVELTAAGLKGTAEGRISAIARTLDPHAHTLSVEASVSNREQHLKPGMFVTLKIMLGATRQVLLIPPQAVVPTGGAATVWCVGPDGRAVQKPVELGRYRKDLVEVERGLKPGDEVITAGQQRLEPGAALHVTPYQAVINPELTPAAPISGAAAAGGR